MTQQPSDKTLGNPVPNWRAVPRPNGETLEGRLCRLERLDVARHAEALFNANSLDSDGVNWTYLPYGPFATLTAYCAWLEQSCCAEDPLFYTIISRATNTPVGVASFMRIDPANGVIEVGNLNYAPALQRGPAATEAMFLMMRQAFTLGYRRYEWKCNALNTPSRIAAQRLGFSFEGVFRQAAVVKGRNRDTAWYSIIDSEWPALRARYERWLDPANFDAQGRQRLRLSDLTRPLLVAIG